MQTPALIALLFALCAAATPQPAQAKALQTFHLMTLSAQNPAHELQMPKTVALDPQLPVWVSYTMFAVSAQEKPAGAIVLGVNMPGLADSSAGAKVGFSADTMTRLPADPNLTTRLTQQWGQHTPEQMATILGPELHAAYQALQIGKGAVYGKTIVKRYPAPGEALGPSAPPLVLSLELANSLQPAMVVATVGQGDIPAQHQNHFAAYSGDNQRTELQLTGGLSVLIAGIYFFGLKQIRKNDLTEALDKADTVAKSEAPHPASAARILSRSLTPQPQETFFDGTGRHSVPNETFNRPAQQANAAIARTAKSVAEATV